ADKVLEGQAGGLAHWPNQVRLLPKGQPLLPPPIDPAVQDAVYQALLAGRQLQVSYRPREATETKSYPVHPLALVVRNQVSYLVCTLRDYPQIRQLLLHRMLSAQLLSDPATPQPDFDLDSYIAAGNFGFSHGGMVRLHAVFDASAVLTLAETPLSEDQTLSPQADGTILLSACVNDTGELDTWLHGFGKLCREWRKQAVDASP
ncbi:helix-turn-helix transcriptional regulator, partial [Craterilacuibacter sp.]|uniref:helix-turn-helix transcriptional regulator n=1 Tax=Craterilacuibacter sp. TaxID=2870909 RepID=UPI003F36B83E